MLNFLRKLRRPSARGGKEMKSTKYLKYALGEIILVVIGILIALSINNWNEQRKKGEQSDKAMLELLEEIRVAKNAIESRQALNKEVVKIMKRYLENGIVNPTDSTKSRVVGYSFAYAPVDLFLPLLEREISADHLILKQPKLTQNMRAFKSQKFSVDQERYYLDEYWNRNMVSFLKERGLRLSFVSKAGGIDRNVDGIEKLFDSSEFQDLIAMEFFHVSSYTDRVSRLSTLMDEIEQELVDIIGKN